MKILDCFSGNLSTWFDKDFAKNNVVKNDIRKGLTLEKEGQIIEIIADHNNNMFAENTIIDGGEFDMIYADPPHLINASGIMFKTYTDLNAYQLLTVEQDLINMLNNLNDNLSANGVVLIKWNNRDFSLKPLFKYSKLKLLFGTTSYKKAETYYYVAIKNIERRKNKMNTNTNNNNNNNNETPTLLTDHHKNLYQYLEISTNFGFELNVEMIARAFPHVYNFKSQKGNYSNCPLLYQHIDELNASNEIDKIIIKNNNKFKLGTEQEAIDYYNKMISKAMRLLVKASVVKRKISKHGQAKLIDNDFNYNDPLSFIETFITWKEQGNNDNNE